MPGDGIDLPNAMCENTSIDDFADSLRKDYGLYPAGSERVSGGTVTEHVSIDVSRNSCDI